jgi:hypothetical protein
MYYHRAFAPPARGVRRLNKARASTWSWWWWIAVTAR